MKTFGILGAWRRRLRDRAGDRQAQSDYAGIYRSPSDPYWQIATFARPGIADAPDPCLIEQLIERGRPE